MGRPRKPPAYLVEATVRTSAKLAELSCDTARVGVFYVVWGEGKLSVPYPGLFNSQAHLRELAGRFEPYVDEWIRVGLLEVAPRLCQRCRLHWESMPPRAGALVVHDWHEHQYDPRKVERQREYEERQRQTGVSDAVSDGVSDANPTPFPTPDSRARGRRRAVNVERRTENGISPHGEIESPRDSPATPERADIQVLLEGGYRRVTAKQRAVLDEIADRHRRKGDDGSWFAVKTIATAADDVDPLRAVIVADKAEQAANRRRIAEDESIWATTKQRDRAEAAAILGGSRQP